MRKVVYAIYIVIAVLITAVACKTNEEIPAGIASSAESTSPDTSSEDIASDIMQSALASKDETNSASTIVSSSIPLENEVRSEKSESKLVSSSVAAKEKEASKEVKVQVSSSEPSKPQDKPVEKVASSGNPASDEIEEDVYEVTTSNPTAEKIEASNPNSDIFIMEGAVCEKVTPDHWAFDRTYKQGELLGKIAKTKATGNLGELEARTLPVGTEIYATDNFVIFLVKLSNSETILKYHMLIEG